MNGTSATTVGVQRRSNRGRALLATAIAAFLIGGAAVWTLVRWNDNPIGRMLEMRPEEAAVPAPPAPGRVPLSANTAELVRDAREASVAEQQGGLDQRIAAMEQRLVRLDLQAAAAENNAARAEGLLIAFAARRSIERGTQLGYLTDQLQLRFGNAQPVAVRTVIEASRNPVTLDQLLARLDRIGPSLDRAPEGESTLDWFSRELGELFVVRRVDTPSPAPQKRLERARLFLESGRVEDAVAEVRMLPNAVAARDWIADAERFASAQRALEVLETAAVLEQRQLRDGLGNPVR